MECKLKFINKKYDKYLYMLEEKNIKIKKEKINKKIIKCFLYLLIILTKSSSINKDINPIIAVV